MQLKESAVNTTRINKMHINIISQITNYLKSTKKKKNNIGRKVHFSRSHLFVFIHILMVIESPDMDLAKIVIIDKRLRHKGRIKLQNWKQQR